MELNFDAKVKSIEGKDLMIVNAANKEEPATLKWVAVEALMANPRNDNADGQEKIRRYTLAQKIHKGGIVNCTTEEIALMKERVGACMATNVVGATMPMFEKGVTKEEKKNAKA